MSRSILRGFKTTLASLILDDIQLNRNSYYYFIGKTDPWQTTSDVPPQALQQNLNTEIEARNNAQFFKKINPNDVTLVVPRRDWVSGEVIPQWDHRIDMTPVIYYRVVEVDKQYEVFVCLDNGGNAPSTVKPTTTTLNWFKTSDGYTWKYVYTVPQFKYRNFVQTNYMPVQLQLSDSFYNRGQLTQINVIDGGIDYVSDIDTYITIDDPTHPAADTCVYVVQNVASNGKILTLQAQNRGKNYTDCVLIQSSQTGIGALLSPVINDTSTSDGVVTDVAILDGGIGYAVGDVFTAKIGMAKLIPIVAGSGELIDIYIVDGGYGYTISPTLHINHISSSSSAITGITPETATAEAVVYGGKIIKCNITQRGKYYPTTRQTTLTILGDGKNASAIPVVQNGKIVDVIMADIGSGYSYANIHIGGNGTGAQLIASLATNDFNSRQSIIEQTAIAGAIHSIKLNDTTYNYNKQPSIQIEGDGTGCTAVVHFNSDTKQIKRIEVTNPGYGYTYANVTLTPHSSDVGTIAASATAILSPTGGHGANIVEQFQADTLAISQSLNVDNALVDMERSFRQFGIVRNPKTTIVGKIFRGNKDICAYNIEYTPTQAIILQAGDKIKMSTGGSQTTYLVLSATDSTAMLQPITTSPRQPLGVLTNANNPLTLYTCTAVLKEPVVDKYTGQLLYLANEAPFQFMENQGILIKTFLKF